MELSGFIELPVRVAGAGALSNSTTTPPFDRLLPAQALAEPLWLLTADAVLAQYSDLVIRV